METKMFEIRDRMTFIPVLATALIARSEEERYLLRRAGYAEEQIGTELPEGYRRYIWLSYLTAEQATYDPYHWPNRTLAHAHHHIEEAWDSLRSGDVIDVQVLTGERTTPKVSERLTAPLP